MYECPITVYTQEILNHMVIERENVITTKISETIGVDINREELIKALNYDRQQYEKGYADAKAEYESMLDKIRAEIEQRSYGIANDSVIQGMVYEREDILEIINKYRKEQTEE